MAVTIEVRECKGVPILEVTGNIGDAEAREFSDALGSLYNKEHKRIVIDISRLNFIDSQGLGTIVSHNARMGKEDRELIILNSNPDPNAFVASLFKMTNLYKVLRIITDINEI